MIIGFLNQKGGVGKTTLAVNVADYLSSAMGKRVLVIDADPQGSSLDWLARGEEECGFDMVGLPKPVIHKQIEKLKQGYDCVLIDGPPRVTAVMRSAMLSCDLVVVPIQPSPYDLWASEEVMELYEECKVFKPKLKLKFAINRKQPRTAIGSDFVAVLAEREWVAFSTTVCQRTVFAQSAALGKTIGNYGNDGQARFEIEYLSDEIIKELG